MAIAKPTPMLLLLLALLLVSQGALGELIVVQGGVPAPAPEEEDSLTDYYGWLGGVHQGSAPKYNYSDNPTYEDSTTSLAASSKPKSSKDIIVVALDGSGDYKSVQDAVDAVPKGNTKRVTIHIKAGIYKEKVIIPSGTPYITIEGEGQKKTIIVWDDTASTKRKGKVLSTFGSATFAVNSDHFIARLLTFKNSAPVQAPGAVGEQAVALRLSGDKAALYFVSVLGAQDTLYLHKGYHYISNSYIEGSIDFIFGDGRALIRKCHLHSIAKTFGSLTAQKRLDKKDAGGFSIVGCVITGSGSIFLGRAWGPYSRVVYSYCYFADIIRPGGWDNWSDPKREKTVFYGEYACFGPGATTFDTFPKWGQRLTRAQAAPFLSFSFINGKDWLPSFI
eukprot:TRINITY_DN16385_c0_g1_i1.p1 TRINITY_DN16385_c0_g1~~TRINITY_DN16385_c0_g1_i1.p1  ORF type:complete len:391 (+),score=33.12 TRINITY_DN16385_c0_g1_i1:199-1371(+)